MREFLCVALVALIVGAGGCATPAERLGIKAAAAGLSRTHVPAGPYQLVAFQASGSDSQASRLHVYLDGDGEPWLRGRWPAPDPTPRHPLALELLLVDPAPAVYLSRPCYGGQARSPSCTPELWTWGRYSAEVVEALERALEHLSVSRGIREFVLIGHSGGGTLATLLAGRRDDVVALVTVAANLDHQRWAEAHGYLPLRESLRPLDAPPPAGVIRWHLVGGRDSVVPERFTRAALATDPQARVRRYPDFDHHCCWVGVWSDVLSELERELER